MAAPISEAEIRQVVSQVLNRMQTGTAASWDSTQYGGRKLVGIFEDMNEAIEAANVGYRAVRAMSVEQREKIITEIRRLTREEAPGNKRSRLVILTPTGELFARDILNEFIQMEERVFSSLPPRDRKSFSRIGAKLALQLNDAVDA